MISPKKPSSKTNVDLSKDKIQSVALKKVSPIVAIKPKTAVKKPVPAKGQLAVTDLVAKTIALAKNKKTNEVSEEMNLAVHEEMDQQVKEDKPKAKKVGKLALINKAFDEEAIYSQVNATHPKPLILSVQKKNATKGRPANSKLIQLDDKQVLRQKTKGMQSFTDQWEDDKLEYSDPSTIKDEGDIVTETANSIRDDTDNLDENDTDDTIKKKLFNQAIKTS